MIRTTLALFALTLLPTGTPKNGEDYLKLAEQRLYRWPKPGVVVRFEAQTDVLDPMLAAMKHDVEKKPDAEASRFIDALLNLEIHGTIDTETGKLTIDVSVPYQTSDARTKGSIEEIKRRVTMTISGCFQGLPLNDPSLLHSGSKVTGCEESHDSIQITIAGERAGQATRLKLGRQSLLPETVETPSFTGRFQFEESIPGHFAVSRLDITPRGGTENHAEYTYQTEGSLLFPASVKVSSRDQIATVNFHSLSIVQRAR